MFGMENGLWEKSIFFSSSLHSYIGKSTIQQKANWFSSTRLRSRPILVRARPAKAVNFSGRPQTKKTASPSLRPSCARIASVRSGPDVLGERAGAALLALAPEDVAEARLALALRPGIHAVAEGAVAAGRRGDRPHLDLRVGGDLAGEDLEAGVAEMLRDVLHLDRVAEVRLVGAVFPHRVRIGDARELLRHALAAAELEEQLAQHRLDRLEHVLLLDEAHLDVELVELAGRAVGAGVLVAEAGRDLEVAVEARDHDELLELLRRLRQGVELAGMQPRRHQKVARALRRGRRQDRRLELEEAGAGHAPADRRDDLRPLQDVAVELVAAKVEEAVFQPRLLRVFGVAEHRQRQLGRGAQHLDLAGENLHRPRSAGRRSRSPRAAAAPCRRRGSPIRSAPSRRP